VRGNQSVNGIADPFVTGLQLLAHVVADADLGERFLAITGLTADDLRLRAADAGVLAALIDFVAARESDLVAAADALGIAPAAIIAAGHALGGGSEQWT
jgi:adenine/guanine phosphoribosyltransferase-like PRPP-binding protein